MSPHRKSRALRRRVLAGVAALWLPLAGSCIPWAGEPQQGRRIDGPCSRVNVLDGISEEDPSEFMDLFRCLDTEGAFAGWRGTVAAIEVGQAPDGRSLAWHSARLINSLLVHADPGAMLSTVQRLFDENEALFFELVPALSEWLYGDSWIAIEQGIDEDPAYVYDDARLVNGVARPLLEVAFALDEALLAGQPDRWARAAAWMLAEPATERALEDLAALIDDEDLSPLFDDYNEDLGLALRETTLQGPDGPRNLVAELAADLVRPGSGGSPLSQMLPEIQTMLLSPRVVNQVADRVTELFDLGRLQRMPAAIHHLTATTNPETGHSALEDLLWIFAELDTPCGIDLILWDIELSDSFSVDLLEILADLSASPENVSDLTRFVDSPLQGLIAAAAAGACDDVDRGGLNDRLGTLEALRDSDVLDTLLPLVYALQGGEGGHNVLPELVALLGDLRDTGLLADLAPVLHPLTDPALGHLPNVMDILGAYVSSNPPGPSGDLNRMMFLVQQLVRSGTDLQTGFSATPLEVLLSPLPATIDAAGPAVGTFCLRFADLLDPARANPPRPESVSGNFIYTFAPILELEDELGLFDVVSAMLDDPGIFTSVLQVGADPAVQASLLDAGVRPLEGEEPVEVPMSWLGARTSGGTGRWLLEALRMVLTVVDGITPSQED